MKLLPRVRRIVLLSFLSLVLPAQGVGAQTVPPPTRGAPAPADVAVVLVANVLPAVVIAGVHAHRDGRPVLESVLTAAGGAVVHVTGKALAGVDAPGAGLAGRYSGGLGAGIARNAMAGKAPFSCLTFPVGPLWLNTVGCDRPTLTIDVVTVVGTFAGWHQGTLAVDESLATGAVVFRAPTSTRPARRGWAIGGAILVQESASPWVVRDRLRHELIHVIQHDMAQITLSRPLEDRLRRTFPGRPATGSRWLDAGSYAAVGALLGLTPLDPRPVLENEARALDGADYRP